MDRIPSPAQALLLASASKERISRNELKANDKRKVFPTAASNWAGLDNSILKHGWATKRNDEGQIYYRATKKGLTAIKRYLAAANEVQKANK